MTREWITREEALALSPGRRQELLDALLAGDVRARERLEDGQTLRIETSDWVGAATDGDQSFMPSSPFVGDRIEFNLKNMRATFGLDQPPTNPRIKGTPGRKGKIPWERAGFEILGQSYRGELPEPDGLGSVVQLYRDWCDKQDPPLEHPERTQLYDHAHDLYAEIRRAFRK